MRRMKYSTKRNETQIQTKGRFGEFNLENDVIYDTLNLRLQLFFGVSATKTLIRKLAYVKIIQPEFFLIVTFFRLSILR